jgi:putative transposase
MDWFSRYVISWELSTSLEVDFCVRALEEALTIGVPEIFNSDQGSQFTSEDFVSILALMEFILVWMERVEPWIISSPRDCGDH